jgi:clan AA aspartic protease (TIGR02281 family)
MKSLLKSLAIATMLIAPQVASAVELTCSAPIVYVGQQSRDAHDTVVGVDVYYSNGEWQVRHRMGNGSEVNRVNQYAMRDTSNRNMTQWRGESYKYPGILWMVGEIQRDKRTGQPVYVEWIYNRGRLTMNTAANCNEQVVARRPEPQYVPQPAPQPAPPPAPPTVTLPTVIVVPPAVVQNPAPVPLPRVVQNPAPAQPPAAQNPAPQPPAAKPPRRNSVPITVYNERAVLIDVGLGRQVVNMMLDTGASTSAITDEVANALVRDGQARWLGTRTFKMADGSMTEALALVINEVRIGSHVVRDVEASVVPNGTMMLLGFPVVNQIGPFMINTRTRELVFEEEA